MRFIKQRQFAEWCSVKPPAISDLLKRGILHSVERKIDIDDPLNLSYLSRHNPELASRIANGEDIGDIVPSAIPGAGRGPASTRKEPAQKQTKNPRIDPVVMEARREEARKEEDSDDDLAETQPSLSGLTESEVAEAVRKPLYDARKARLAAEKEAVNLDILHKTLGEREIFDELIQQLWQSMQLNYIDVAPKQAALICKRLGMVGHELEVIEVLEGDIKKRQDNVAKAVSDVLKMRLSNPVEKVEE